MPNTANRRNLKTLMDLLSDAHADITAKAVKVNERLMLNLRLGADRELGELLELLDAQQNRCQRTHEEVEQIKKNLKVI